jgi:beta-glucosidase
MQTTLDWLFVHPRGMENMVTYIKERYNNTPMFISENGECKPNKYWLHVFEKILYSLDLVGFGEKENPNSTMETLLHDVKRVEYMNSYLDALATAMRY